ncbi:MAG TPA: glutathione S-transferase family protein, partial [Gammaproteobacteria bacterium]|nr:glutathione S-transferase family protein [Gammaproteobacteria bacterium]
ILTVVQHMLWPSDLGEFEPWQDLEAGLAPILTTQVGDMFLPWSAANSIAIDNEDEEFTVDLAGNTWTQKPQKYHARSLGVLRARYQEVSDNTELNDILSSCHCLDVLSSE